jgi:hypothetical protein
LGEAFVVVETTPVAAGVGDLEITDGRGVGGGERRCTVDVLRQDDVRRRHIEQVLLVACGEAGGARQGDTDRDTLQVFEMRHVSSYMEEDQNPNDSRAVK